MRPVLKSAVWERVGDQLRVVYDRRDQLLLEDPDGVVEALLDLLATGGRTVAEIAAELRIPVDDVSAAVAELDGCGLLEDSDRLGTFTAVAAERHHSNLGFFESFGSLARSREDHQHALRAAHVLVLGVGGLNSTVVQHLAGLGVGRLTLVDDDVVEPRNFVRQYLYRWSDLGASKVERAGWWVRDFDPTIEVSAVRRRVRGTDDVADLLALARPDAVAAGIDTPAAVDRWVNAACVAARVPYVRAGMYVTEGVVWSVQPGASACLACVPHLDEPSVALARLAAEPDLAEQLAGLALYRSRPRMNRGAGPVAGLLGSLVAFELMRYLTGFEPPQYAGRPLTVDFAAGCAMRQADWSRHPACPVCRPPEDVPRSAADTDLAIGRR